MRDTRQLESLLSYQLCQGKLSLKKPDEKIEKLAKKRWDQVAKPLDGMGIFEEMTARMAGILEHTDFDWRLRRVLIFCSDNGVVEEGVCQSTQDVTQAVATAMGSGNSSAGKMAAVNGTQVLPIDIGIACRQEIEGVQNKKVSLGTKNFLQEPAMTLHEMYQAMETGMSLVREAKENGIQLLALGEMGIGNTTTSTAVVTACLGLLAADFTGMGAGLSDDGVCRKISVIQKAIEKYQLYQETPLTILQTVGGLDLAAMVGVILGGAYYGLPVVLDGIVSLAAALVCVKQLPKTKDILFASHVSREKVAKRVLTELELQPVIQADLALGEGTGAILFFSLLDTVMPLYQGGISFEKMKVEEYKRFS